VDGQVESHILYRNTQLINVTEHKFTKTVNLRPQEKTQTFIERISANNGLNPHTITKIDRSII